MELSVAQIHWQFIAVCLGGMRHVEIKHDSVGEQMSNSPSTRHLIPNWLIITLALFVIVVLVVAIRGNPIAPGWGPFGQVSVTETTTTHKK